MQQLTLKTMRPVLFILEGKYSLTGISAPPPVASKFSKSVSLYIEKHTLLMFLHGVCALPTHVQTHKAQAL